MRTLTNLIWFLALASLISALDPFTIWFHESCTKDPRRRWSISPLQRAFSGAKSLAKAAMSMINEVDDYSFFIFRTLYKVERSSESGEAIAQRLQDILTAFIEAQLSSEGDPTDTSFFKNYRYYCDDDRIDGLSRWQVRADPPPEQQPPGYVLQASREWYRSNITTPYREYWDPLNNVRMGATVGCNPSAQITDDEESSIRAQTYDPTPDQVSYPGYPRNMIWATITVCSRALAPMSPMSIEELHLDACLQKVSLPLTAIAMTMTGSTILHEFCHLPPWKLEDIKRPVGRPHFVEGIREPIEIPELVGGDLNERAFSWRAVLSISSPWDSMRNANNLVYYAILAKIRQRSWFLYQGEKLDNFTAEDWKLVYRETLQKVTPNFEIDSDEEDFGRHQ